MRDRVTTGYYRGVATNTRTLHATPETVWSVLADGWLYPLWVVGASRMREVDDDWPAVGSRLHHSVGAWPLLLDDVTEVVEAVPGASLTLQARSRPAGVAQVRLTLEAISAETRVVLEEEPVSGPGALVPKALLDPTIGWRNVETLRRLAYVVEGRAAGTN
jgi:uncharacterized protein YndB with AHSA1/START domain